MDAGGGGVFLFHLSSRIQPPPGSRPKWPPAWQIHSLGPALNGALMYDERGWYGSFFLGVSYSYITYFTIGL